MTTTERIQKPMPGTEPKGEPVEAAAWKNLWFSKDGQTILGKPLYASETKAAEAAAEYVRATDVKHRGRYTLVGTNNAEFSRRKLSHTIQIPWSRP
jgi:hypothetical protein